MPLDSLTSVCQYPTMLGETQTPILPHLRSTEYVRARKKQIPAISGNKQRDWQRERGRFRWGVFIQVALFHAGALLAPWLFSWEALFVTIGLLFVSGCIGICVGYHRLLTHRSFETYPFIKRALTLIGTLAGQGGPAVWVGTHRIHHQFSDKDGDPHSPKHSFWWGHVIWLYFFENPVARSHAADVMNDPWLRWLDQLWFLPFFGLAILLWWIGGLPFLVWGFFLRMVVTFHSTFAVNSVAHRWGYRTYETPDDSRNNVWVALLTFGEGWHNNHHAFPQSARHGLRRREIDPAFQFIRLLEKCGLAWNVKLPG